MAYSKTRIPTEVYHLTKKENLDSILADKRIRRFGDTECWLCRFPEDMLRYMEYTVLFSKAEVLAVKQRIGIQPEQKQEESMQTMIM